MAKGTTKSGFSFDIPDEKFDNMELVIALSELDEDVLQINKVLNMLFDKKQQKALLNHLRTEDGRVPIGAFSDELAEILEATGAEGKN